MRKLCRVTTFTAGSLLVLTASATSIAVCAQTATPLAAQQGMPSAPSQGSITGHVFLADTNGPARFAHVLLKGVPDGAAKPVDPESAAVSLAGALLGVDDDDDTAKKPAKPAKKQDADDKAESGVFAQIMANAGDMMTSATVDDSGAYTLTGLKPGRYFVHALLPGYIDPLP